MVQELRAHRTRARGHGRETDAHAFALIDVDEAEDLAAKYNVTSVPHFVFLKGGAPADAYVGASAEAQAKLAVCFLSG
ncbi:hypothetical protein JL721_8563 [Aureococcus anophagefferens]|nr:hypothetical protein JL721_8563 [Aureococcus anophagefferens]